MGTRVGNGSRQGWIGASYGPETLKDMGLAFDQAWAEISSHFNRNGRQSQTMRNRLAKALLAVSTDDSHDVIELKNAALLQLAMDYRVSTTASTVSNTRRRAGAE